MSGLIVRLLGFRFPASGGVKVPRWFIRTGRLDSLARRLGER